MAALAAAFSVSFLSGALADERQKIIDLFGNLRPSVGALYSQDGGGDMNFLCSATAIAHHEGATVVLTAHHCLRKGVAYLINFGDNRMRPVTVWKIPHYEVDKQKHPRRYNEPETDMALFLMKGTDVPLARIAASSALRPGAKIAMMGYPLGVAKITYEGIFAGTFDRPGADNDGYLLLQIFGAPGSSGSSVVSVDTGEIVGILVSARQAMAGLPVIFATPMEYRRHLIPVLPKGPDDGRK